MIEHLLKSWFPHITRGMTDAIEQLFWLFAACIPAALMIWLMWLFLPRPK